MCCGGMERLWCREKMLGAVEAWNRKCDGDWGLEATLWRCGALEAPGPELLEA